MYKKVSANLNFVDREKAVEEFWKENKIFEKTCEKKGPSYVFYDGPPTANETKVIFTAMYFTPGARPMFSMTVRRLPTASRTSVTFLLVLSKT